MVTTRRANADAPTWGDAAGKTRLISHMNKDHAQDLTHILQHCNRLTATEAADARLLDVTPSSMTVDTRSGVHVVVLDPPMEWDARRQRLIDLTMDARRALGIPMEAEDDHGSGVVSSSARADGKGVTVERYLPPVSHHWIVLFSVIFYFINYAALRNGYLEPGTVCGRIIEAVPFPGGLAGWNWLTRVIFVPVVGIHVLESWWLDRTRLTKHGVARFSGLWFAWMISCSLEGLATFQRFDGEVARLQARGVKNA